MDALDRMLAVLAEGPHPPGRPAVTLTWAQSLDGSIAAADRRPLALSGPASLTMTHQLRSAHDAILVGIGAVLADDPQLTVRHAAGEQPQPVVLDTHLRLPLQSALLRHPRPPWIACGPEPAPQRRAALAAAGATVLPAGSARDRVDLPTLLSQLRARGVRRLMVEGGAQVITSFLAAHFVDWLVLTISPHLFGGLHGLARPLAHALPAAPRLQGSQWMQLGEDWVVWGRVAWGTG